MAQGSNFQEKTLNAFTMWGSTYNDKPIFARQFTGGVISSNMKDTHRVMMPTIFVGFDGDMGRDLGEVLEENMKLKREIEILTDMQKNHLIRRIDAFSEEMKHLSLRKWWQFWK